MQSVRRPSLPLGASLTGVVVEFGAGDETAVKVKYFETFDFPDTFQARIRHVARNPQATVADGARLSKDLGAFSGACVRELLDKAEVEAADVVAVGSHGQTVFHDGDAGVTLQIGCAAHIAEATRIDTVADFRQTDVAAGGHGAPLAPLYHNAMLRSSDGGVKRVILNLGGIANVSILSADGGVRGWDTGPGVCWLDQYSDQPNQCPSTCWTCPHPFPYIFP